MMDKWLIKPLVFGWIEGPKSHLTSGLDSNLIMKVPYLGFVLTNHKLNILVDTGINEKYIKDGLAWGALPAEGGEKFVIKALSSINLRPEDIDIVLYTHLHNDHAGNCHLFKNAKHVFQDTEWNELLSPLPSMKIRGDYDQSIIEQLKHCTCEKLFGDTNYLKGIEIQHSPGHTAGSQCIIVTTQQGNYILTGDTLHIPHIGYGYLETITTLNKEVINVTPVPKAWDEIAPSTLVYDHYAWYASVDRIKSSFQNPNYVLAGHDPSIVDQTFGELNSGGHYDV